MTRQRIVRLLALQIVTLLVLFVIGATLGFLAGTVTAWI